MNVQLPDELAIDRQKCSIFNAIYDTESSSNSTSLVLWRLPDQVRIGEKKLAAESLTLAPSVFWANRERKSSVIGQIRLQRQDGRILLKCPAQASI